MGTTTKAAFVGGQKVLLNSGGSLVTSTGQAVGAVGGVKPSNWFASQEFTSPVAYTSTDLTVANRRSRRLPFSGGRVIGYNAGAVPSAGMNYAVGVAGSADVNQQAASLQQITWGGGKADPVAAALFKGTANLNIVEFALSDSFNLQSVARIDGGTGYISELRTYAPNGLATVYALAADQGGAATQLRTAGGVAFSGTTKAGNFVTANQTGYTTPGVAQHFIFGDLLLFTPDYPVYTVAAGGDSISHGQYGDEGRYNEMRISCDAISLSGVANVEYLGHTRPGKGVDDFGPSDVAFLRTMRPDIFVYTPSTPNDGGMDATSTMNKAKNRLAEIHQCCKDLSVRLIVATSTPWAPFTAGQDNALKAFNVWLKTWADQTGTPLHDRYTATTDGASPASLLPQYQWPTGTAGQKAHANATCYQALAVPMQALIRTVIGK